MWGATYITLFTWLKFGSKAIKYLYQPTSDLFVGFTKKKNYFFLIKETNNITRDFRLQPGSRLYLHSSEILLSV
jgi:hypothetical protein